jgi:hypothetical protein
MSAGFVELERVESRVLGALRFVDAVTGIAISSPFTVAAPGVRLLRNRSGLYVIHKAPGFEAYLASFAMPPATPAVGSVGIELTVGDPSGRYLPRAATLALPRDPSPSATASLFQPVDIPLFPAPSARIAFNWAVLRVTVTAANGDRLGGALLRVLRNGGVLARGLSDWRGEALVPVAGVPVTTFGDSSGAVVISVIEVALQGVFDAASGSRVPDADVHGGRAPAVLPIVDPAALEAAAATLANSQQTLSIAARRSQSVSLVIG